MTMVADTKAVDVAHGMLVLAIKYRNGAPEDIVHWAVRDGLLTAEQVGRAPVVALAFARAARSEADERHKYAAHLAGSHAHHNWTYGRLLTQDPRKAHHESHERSPHLNHKHPHPYDLF